MEIDEDPFNFTDAQVAEMWRKGISWCGRIFRGISYFVIALLLVRINTYGLSNGYYLAFAIALLGAGSSSARVAQLSITVLLMMAVVPLNVIDTIKVAMN